MKRKDLTPARHDMYFTIGETVGQPGSRIPSLGINWVHVPPCISTENWPAFSVPSDGAFTTVSHRYTGDWVVDDDGSFYKNDKRSAFQPFLELPKRVPAPLELAIHLAGDTVERELLESHGWHVKEAHDVAGSPADFQRYIQSSRGEFSCAKPAYVRMLTSWISDRTLCYLASGRPAIIQDTGPTRYCSGREGVLRFRDLEGAIECFEAIESDYSAHRRRTRTRRATLFCLEGSRGRSRPLQHAKKRVVLHTPRFSLRRANRKLRWFSRRPWPRSRGLRSRAHQSASGSRDDARADSFEASINRDAG